MNRTIRAGDPDFQPNFSNSHLIPESTLRPWVYDEDYEQKYQAEVDEFEQTNFFVCPFKGYCDGPLDQKKKLDPPKKSLRKPPSAASFKTDLSEDAQVQDLLKTIKLDEETLTAEAENGPAADSLPKPKHTLGHNASTSALPPANLGAGRRTLSMSSSQPLLFGGSTAGGAGNGGGNNNNNSRPPSSRPAPRPATAASARAAAAVPPPQARSRPGTAAAGRAAAAGAAGSPSATARSRAFVAEMEALAAEARRGRTPPPAAAAAALPAAAAAAAAAGPVGGAALRAARARGGAAAAAAARTRQLDKLRTMPRSAAWMPRYASQKAIDDQMARFNPAGPATRSNSRVGKLPLGQPRPRRAATPGGGGGGGASARPTTSSTGRPSEFELFARYHHQGGGGGEEEGPPSPRLAPVRRRTPPGGETERMLRRTEELRRSNAEFSRFTHERVKKDHTWQLMGQDGVVDDVRQWASESRLSFQETPEMTAERRRAPVFPEYNIKSSDARVFAETAIRQGIPMYVSGSMGGKKQQM